MNTVPGFRNRVRVKSHIYLDLDYVDLAIEVVYSPLWHETTK